MLGKVVTCERKKGDDKGGKKKSDKNYKHLHL